MPGLTDADKKGFIDKTIAALSGNKAALIAAGWDPTQRITNLQAGVTTVTNDEAVISPLEVALKQAFDTRRANLDHNYALASASISGAEGALGKDHPLVDDLHQIRGSMSNAPAPATPPKP